MADQKIVPCLWFDSNCEEAVNYYIDVFENSPYKAGTSKLVELQRYEKGIEAPGAEEMEGKVLTAIFELAGQRFMALDGGPVFKLSEAMSLSIDCQDQKEIDYFADRLSAVPEAEVCGWAKDKFGLSWQIQPTMLGELSRGTDREKAHRVFNAMLKMKRINIAELEAAAAGK